MLNYQRTEPRQAINIEQVINVIYSQGKSEKEHHVVRPKMKAKVPPAPMKKRNKIGRNDKCSCGSEKKYKYCCIKKG